MDQQKNVYETSETLHIPILRRKWQIISLQATSTISLIALLIKMNSTYGNCSEQFIIDHNEDSWCPAYEHSRGLMWLSNRHDLLIPDFLLGVNQSGILTLIGPLFLCVVASLAIDRYWASSLSLQNKINQGAAAIFLVWMIVPFILSWFFTMATHSEGLHLPFGNENADLNHLSDLFSPFDLIFELVFLGIVFAPIFAGLVGIWGLSRRLIAWAVGYYILVIAFHSILTFEPISSQIDVGLSAIPNQIGEGTMFGGLISPLAFSLLTISVLMLVFMESGFAVINHLEYAASLPEEVKRNQDYIRQFNNVVNAHLFQFVIVIFLVSSTTALALSFDDLLISIVGILEGTQWTGQVKESLELQMTYGKVISAGLFIIVVASMRFVVPWQRVTGFLETTLIRIREQFSQKDPDNELSQGG